MESAHAIYAIPGFSEPVSSMTHLLGGGIALALGVLLVLRAGRCRAHRVALAVFVFGTVNMFAMSGVFHLLSPGGTPRYVLLLLDHAGIWVMIAGTCTPMYLTLCRGKTRWSLLVLVWGLAIVGLVLKTVFFDV
ncbi:MAG: hemolysin III family protein, partial [Myxococcota bacterium]|nr:hemolysin III family protein [Myxococcota bacterium]